MALEKGPLRDLKTGTGFADAKLSEILPTARVAHFVRMTDDARDARFVRIAKTSLASLASVWMATNAGRIPI